MPKLVIEQVPMYNSAFFYNLHLSITFNQMTDILLVTKLVRMSGEL